MCSEAHIGFQNIDTMFFTLVIFIPPPQFESPLNQGGTHLILRRHSRINPGQFKYPQSVWVGPIPYFRMKTAESALRYPHVFIYLGPPARRCSGYQWTAKATMLLTIYSLITVHCMRWGLFKACTNSRPIVWLSALWNQMSSNSPFFMNIQERTPKRLNSWNNRA